VSAEPSSRTPVRPDFERSFLRRARRVRAALSAKLLLAGLAAGATAGALLTALAWWQRQGTLRPLAFAVGLALGLLVGVVLALRRRWSDEDVALYLDAKLGTAEAIATALEGARSDAHDTARERALLALSGAKQRVAPRVLTRLHGFFPVGSAAAVLLMVIPLPPLPREPLDPPGVERIEKDDVPGLDRIEALAALGGADPAQGERLRKLAEEAKKLRAELARGLEKREALARIARLRDEVAAERMRFGDRANRSGLEAAVSELERQRITTKAARALGVGDITEFDAEMQRLAALAEKQDRDVAKRTLEEAEKAAREKGAEGLAGALERERRKFSEAEAEMNALRELAKRLEGSLDDSGKEALGEANRSGSAEAQQKLAEALERALGELSEEERQKLAESLRQELGRGGGSMEPMTREELEELARRLAEKDGADRLREQLRELARRDPSDDARRQRGLDEAERGGADAERSLGAVPVPLGGSETPGGGGNPRQELPEQDGAPGSGSGDDPGSGDHQGKTEPLDVNELRSKANVKALPGTPMHAATMGRAPGRAGETANQLGAGVLGTVGPSEIGAVEGSEIPEEYREQVGRYFEP
jgi:hypothetical protein